MISLLKDILSKNIMVDSSLFDENDFYSRFPRDLKRARKQIVIDSPFLTEKRALYYSPIFKKLIKRKIKIRINTRKPNYHSFQMKLEAQKAIQILLKAGVKVYIYNDLRHWKLAIIDNKILWEGSLNILSHKCSREIMRRSTSYYLCRKMINFAKIYN